MLANKGKPKRRGVQWQIERRRLEREAKLGAIALVRLCRLLGLTWDRVSSFLRVSSDTLRRWLRRWREDRLAIEPRGRPHARASTEARQQVLAALGFFGPGVEVAVLRRMFPYVARRELEDLVARYRRVYRKRGTLLHQLTWTNDAAVWAMDFTEAPTEIDGDFPYVLVVRDLGSSKLLLSLPTREQTAGGRSATRSARSSSSTVRRSSSRATTAPASSRSSPGSCSRATACSRSTRLPARRRTTAPARPASAD